MREDGRGQSKGLLCALLFLEALFEEETSFPSLNSFVYKCVWGGLLLCGCSPVPGGCTMSVGKKGLHAQIRTRGEEAQGFPGPAMVPWLPCVVNILHF